MMGAKVDLQDVFSEETVVRSECPSCGTVDIPAEDVTLFVSGADVDPTYRYVCPQCYTTVQKPTSAKAIPMLRNAGARVVEVPAEVVERVLDARMLDEDDLLNFMQALSGEDHLARLAAGRRTRWAR